MQQYYDGFSHRKTSPAVFKGILVILCYTAFQYGKKQILPDGYGSWKPAADLLLTLCFLLFLAACLYRDLGIFRVFPAVSFVAIRETGRMVTLILPYLTGLPTLILRWRQSSGHTVSEADALFFALLAVNGMWILIYGFRVLILHVSLSSIRKQFPESPPSIHPAELQYMLLPALTSFCIHLLLNLILFRSDSRGGELFLFDLYPVLRLFVPILLLLSLVSVLYGVQLYQRMVVLRQDQSSRAVLEEQLKSMQEYLQEERRIQSGIRSMKHDMKNTVSVIMQLAKKIPENQNTELEQYLSELEQSLQELDYRFHTGSAVVDALLNMKYHKTVQQISGLHGIGLSNIKKAAEKYDGAVAWEAADHVFRLSVMLKNKS